MFSKELELSIASLFDKAHEANIQYITVEHLLLMILSDYEVKEFFKSEVLNESDQKTLMRNIDSIFIHKGIMKDKKTDNNVSDIVFFKKKLI